MTELDVTVDGNLTSNTTPATTDRLLLVDAGTEELQDITLANALKVVNELTANTTPATTDLLYLVDDPAGTPAPQKITLENVLKVVNSLTADSSPDTAADYVLSYDANAGAAKKVLMNLVGGQDTTPYRLSVSVASNNLTVALKNKNGDDPTSSVPVKVQIGDTVRTITSALSVTTNAGTNWCNAGSTELAAKEIDYFVYLGYNATDGVVIGFARIPYASTYSEFNTTNTNARYCAISTITNAAADDAYTVIGRFAATLSAGAGYTWTVPTFTNINLKHTPTYETRFLSWQPVYTGFSSDPPAPACRYVINGKKMTLYFRDATNGTSNATTLTMTTPMSTSPTTTRYTNNVRVVDNGTVQASPGMVELAQGDSIADVTINYSTTGTWTNSGGKRLASGYLDVEI